MHWGSFWWGVLCAYGLTTILVLLLMFFPMKKDNDS